MGSAPSKLALAALAACVSLTACGGSSSDQPSAPTAATAGSTQVRKVSANTAGESEIAAALKAAGVSNSERWAKEVVEYRPYAADDSNLTSLRQNLAKYNPGEETVNKIVSALTP
ncbi:pectin methylesterase-like acyl-CoA thioesterase [Streptosporangium album]|uniref:Pectin methylesterase-like acyl-CoA thioesterase n=1 Tax=Streptosporangium album TaxID=47479 RepID=A0A7W7RU18_9ACTN|nr:hypothetical protein [Streptosporangium album]MBB4938117.1 pectin methylesterase-like acyl-CoA thioesterase [Streptosporangium album]